MSRNAGRAIVASCTLAGVIGAGILIYTGFVGDRAVAQAIPDVGQFRAGSALGDERAGFSGRTRIIILGGQESCLESQDVTAEMEGFFVGVLADPEAEPVLREVGQSVVVRGLQGQILGLLPEGYACQDLVGLLRHVRAASTRVPEPSPIYSALVERPAEVVDDLVANDRTEDANRYVDLLEEFEGDTPAVRTAKTRLGR